MVKVWLLGLGKMSNTFWVLSNTATPEFSVSQMPSDSGFNSIGLLAIKLFPVKPAKFGSNKVHLKQPNVVCTAHYWCKK